MDGFGLTTKERIKDRLQQTTDNFDDVIDRIILAVTSRIETMCGRRFMQAEYADELHDGSDSYGSLRTTLIVKNAPVQAIESVEYKTGVNSSPFWTAFSEDDYDLDAEAGLLHFRHGLPCGRRNIRITYTGGYSGYSIGVSNYWVYDAVPTGAVDGSNRTYTLPEDADQIVVYADGIRVKAANVTHTDGTDSFTLAVGAEAYTSIAVDYLRSTASPDSEAWLPADLVEAAEEIVVRIFKRRDNDGRTSESFGESATTWSDSFISAEHRATIKNYRRGYDL
jgi:hypothetical protein